VEKENVEVLALGLKLLSEAVLLTEVEAGAAKIVFANQAFERLSGYSLEELQRGGLPLLRGPETDLDALRQWLLHIGEQTSLDLLLYRKDRTPFWDRVTLRKADAGDRALGVQVHTDITRFKELEKHLMPVQKHEATRHLVNGLAHDFNNLLTIIQAYSSLLAGKLKADAKLERYAREIHVSAERGGELVAQLMNLARHEPGEPELVNLHNLVTENTALMKRALGEDIRLNIQAGADLNPVKAHPGRIQQILLILAMTARGAMPQGGELLLQLTNEEMLEQVLGRSSGSRKCVLLLVRNTGAGMHTETLASASDSYFDSAIKNNSTELRLFAVRSQVEQYQGSMDIETETGKRATFRILLPAARTGEN
jgi:two-component system cell cycle sensor histidine kinase/response regulator CckA